MVKKVTADNKPTPEQIYDILNYIYENENGVINRVFDIVKFADNMMFHKTGFPITHCGAGINSISINPNGDVFPCVKISNPNKLITNIFNKDALVQKM